MSLIIGKYQRNGLLCTFFKVPLREKQELHHDFEFKAILIIKISDFSGECSNPGSTAFFLGAVHTRQTWGAGWLLWHHHHRHRYNYLVCHQHLSHLHHSLDNFEWRKPTSMSCIFRTLCSSHAISQDKYVHLLGLRKSFRRREMG